MLNRLKEKNKINTENNSKKRIYLLLCTLTVLVSLFPVSANYIMGSGIIGEWIARMNELEAAIASGAILLFPSSETLLSTPNPVNAMNSNFWFLVPALFYRLIGNLVLVYRLFLIVLQVGTLLCSKLCFERIFARAETKLPAFFGILLYMTCPYRIYVCYDWANLSQAVAWTLLPLYVWAVLGLWESQSKILPLLFGALSLAGIGYADAMFFLISASITLLIVLLTKKLWGLLIPPVSCLLFLPGLYRLFQYIFLDHFRELNLSLQSIMGNGYRFGEFFSSYAWNAGRPGLGLGLLLCLVAGLWMRFVEGNAFSSKRYRAFTVLALCLLVCSLRLFPWELVQRLGAFGLKLVALLHTPAVFFGMASFALCVPAGAGIYEISKHRDKMIARGLPLLVVLLAIGLCIYQCNTITYLNPPPITLP